MPKYQKNAPRHSFNPVAEEIPQAMSIRFNQMVYERKRAGKDVIVLSLGEAFFDIPLFDFKALDYTKGYHYSESQGILELRKRISVYYKKRYGVQADPETEVLISAGSKALIFMSMLSLLQPCEEILLHEPCWLSYPEQARLCGARPRFIPHDVTIRGFEKYLTPRTRMILLNNPNNPAGNVYPAADLQWLVKLCAERGIYLLVDEAYSDFVLDDSFSSVGRFSPRKENILIINSLSKNMGISGWRIGYAIAHPELIQVLLKVNQHIITCAPTILLMYCAKYFDRILEHALPQARAVVKKRRKITKILEELKMEVLPGGATFYFFVSIGKYPGTSLDFATELLERHGVAVVPGFAYGKSMDRFIRVSIGAESEERIRTGLERVREVMEKTKAAGVVFTTEQALENEESPGEAPRSKKKKPRRTTVS